MSWVELHSQSEQLAMTATTAFKNGQTQDAVTLYAEAAELETEAFQSLVTSKKSRTRGITGVSAVSLWFKAKQDLRAEELACSLFSDPEIPGFAKNQLRMFFQPSWAEKSLRRARIKYAMRSL